MPKITAAMKAAVCQARDIGLMGRTTRDVRPGIWLLHGPRIVGGPKLSSAGLLLAVPVTPRRGRVGVAAGPSEQDEPHDKAECRSYHHDAEQVHLSKDRTRTMSEWREPVSQSMPGYHVKVTGRNRLLSATT